MLHFLTSAPQFVLRPILALAQGWVEPAPESAPTWAESVIHVDDSDAAAVLFALRILGGRAARREEQAG